MRKAISRAYCFPSRKVLRLLSRIFLSTGHPGPGAGISRMAKRQTEGSRIKCGMTLWWSFARQIRNRVHHRGVMVIVGVALVVSGCDSNETPDAGLEIVETLDVQRIAEPSGIAYHPRRQSLFVVGDEGDVGEFGLDGVERNFRALPGRSMEGVAVHPETGLVYAVEEGNDRLLEIDPGSLRPLREIDLERTFSGQTVLAEAQPGVEGVAFRDANTLLVVNQGNVQNPEDAPLLLQYAFAIRSFIAITATYDQDQTDLSGLHVEAGRTYIISDQGDVLLELNAVGQVVSRLRLPGEHQEGLTRDATGLFYVAQETGFVLKLRRTP